MTDGGVPPDAITLRGDAPPEDDDVEASLVEELSGVVPDIVTGIDDEEDGAAIDLRSPVDSADFSDEPLVGKLQSARRRWRRKSVTEGEIVRTNIPARMDRLPWARWHTLVVFALGITWILDGLEITSIGVLGSKLERKDTLGFSTFQVGAVGSIYLAGAIIGSLFFGFVSDRHGRKQLYLIVPTCYLIPTVLTACTWNFSSFAACVFFVGFGIGGEYSSMNSAIQEFIPARVRGGVSLIINGSYWLGAMLGAAVSLVVLNPHILPANIGWRFIFAMGGSIGLIILILRCFLPESPRWLVTHGHVDKAEKIVGNLERTIQKRRKKPLKPAKRCIEVRQTHHVRLTAVLKVLIIQYPKRSVLGLTLMVAQAFFYNAIFFTYAIVLTTFYDVPDDRVGIYLIPFAFGNFLGPLTIGRLFDVVGRRVMITTTYAVSGLLLLVNGFLFTNEYFNSITQTLSWSIIFFISSSAASAAYLTVAEVFPMEMRSVAVALFYSMGTGGGGLIGPVLFGALIEKKKRINVFWGYVVGASLMIFAAIIEALWGVPAARKSLEDIAEPMTATKSSGRRGKKRDTAARQHKVAAGDATGPAEEAHEEGRGAFADAEEAQEAVEDVVVVAGEQAAGDCDSEDDDDYRMGEPRPAGGDVEDGESR